MPEHSGSAPKNPAVQTLSIPVGDPVAFKGQPVMTTELMAKSFGAGIRQISDNFANNSTRFVDGVHFHKVQGAELKILKNQPDFIGLVGKTASHLLLWTKRGVARHAKILDTDVAWEIFEQLEDTYFSVHDGGGDLIGIPDFSDPAVAARAWADQYEARRLAERTKAEIGTRREATAMNTASQAVKKANRLALELDRAQSYATVKRMEAYYEQSFNWRLLKSTAVEMNLPPMPVFDANYGKVNAYHADVWREVYALAIPHSEGEAA